MAAGCARSHNVKSAKDYSHHLSKQRLYGGVLTESKPTSPNYEALIAENCHLLSQLNIARREIMRLQAQEHIKSRQTDNILALQSKIQSVTKEFEDKAQREKQINAMALQIKMQQINVLEQRLIKESEDKAQQINVLEQRLIQVSREHNRLQAPRTWRITKPLTKLIDKLYALRRRLDERRLSRQLIAQSLFDPEYYLTQYPDVRQVGIAPVVHYLRYGWWEGRNPSPNFDSQAYLAKNPDVRMAGINPLLHYAQHGKAEGRSMGGAA
ncbi:MAG: hypothetical protein KIH69_021945 [Anaerolineae bacterium]|nr:hypothetical protein [Anaerolineae bacterium]